MSSRTRKLAETNQIAKLVKELNKRMESFEDSVQELKLMKDSIAGMNDELAEQEANLQNNLKENKLKTLTEIAHQLGRSVVTSEELQEYKNEAQKWKDECAKVRASVQKEIKENVDEQLERKLKILQLENENKSAKLTATCESYKSEIGNLKDTITRMSQELDSQKKLTADVARVRSEPTTKQS